MINYYRYKENYLFFPRIWILKRIHEEGNKTVKKIIISEINLDLIEI